jgi:hypothetical protein
MATIAIRRHSHPQYPITLVGCYHIALSRGVDDGHRWHIVHIDHHTAQMTTVGWRTSEHDAIQYAIQAIETGACQ